MYNVLITGEVSEEGVAIIESFARIVHLPEPIDQEALKAHMAEADAVLHKMGRLDQTTLENQSKLKIIARHGVGLDLLDLDYIRTLNIPVTTTPGVNSNAVAELTVAMMINLTRHVSPAKHSLCVEKRWAREGFMGLELKDQTAGLIGLGQIGARVGELLGVFGSRVVVYDPYVKLELAGFQLVGLDELLSHADIISFHCPLTPETRNIISWQNIDQLKEGVFLVNTARGNLIDEDFLAEQLVDGKIGGAALDAFATEPPNSNHRLFTLPNVICTPHIGAMTQGAQVGMATEAAKEIERVLVKQEPCVHNIMG